MATSSDRARIIEELTTRNPGMAHVLADLESDDDLRAVRARTVSGRRRRLERVVLGDHFRHCVEIAPGIGVAIGELFLHPPALGSACHCGVVPPELLASEVAHPQAVFLQELSAIIHARES